jgi:hypothetical protein
MDDAAGEKLYTVLAAAYAAGVPVTRSRRSPWIQ